MREGKIKVVAKKPMLNRDDSKEFEANNALWELNDFHANHGGSPIIVGLVTLLDASVAAKTIPRYKVEFPDGFVNYIRMDNFDNFYDMEFFMK
jgi:hypothetical protein